MNRLLDTHCHLDAYPDPQRVLSAADDAEVDLVAVTETPEAYRRLRTRLGRRDGVQVGLGMHPASRPAAAPGQLERFFRMAPAADWIGEIGLDYPPGLESREKTRQRQVLESVLDHAAVAGKPITMHSRGAAKETVAVVAASPARRVVLHWYSGPVDLVDKALDAGCRFSINPAMLAGAKGRGLMKSIPPDRVLCETDGPYCRTAGRPAQPSDLPHVVRNLAALWRVDLDTAFGRLDQNRSEL